MIKALKILGQKSLDLSKNYLLAGDSDFLYLYIKDQIVEKLNNETELFLFDCSDKADKIEFLVNSLGSQDLFSSSKFVIIKNINKLSKKDKETVIALINSENTHRILCVDHSFLIYDYKSKSNIIKNANTREFQKCLETIDISTPFESEMTQWIKIFAEELNLNINNTYSSKLIETFGNNFSAIYNEMSKSSLSIEKEDDLIRLLNQSSSVKKDKQLWELNQPKENGGEQFSVLLREKKDMERLKYASMAGAAAVSLGLGLATWQTTLRTTVLRPQSTHPPNPLPRPNLSNQKRKSDPHNNSNGFLPLAPLAILRQLRSKVLLASDLMMLHWVLDRYHKSPILGAGSVGGLVPTLTCALPPPPPSLSTSNPLESNPAKPSLVPSALVLLLSSLPVPRTES